MKYVCLGLLLLVFSVSIIYFTPIHKEVFSSGKLVDKTKHVDGKLKFLLDVNGELVITETNEFDYNEVDVDDNLSYYKGFNAFGIEVSSGAFINKKEN